MANGRRTTTEKAPAEETYGTFTKGDQKTVAYSRKRAVQLRFDGWQQVSEGNAPDANLDVPPTPDA